MKFIKSLQFRILAMLILIGIIPAVIATRSVVRGYEERAVSLRGMNVRNQCEILCNQLIDADYFDNTDSDIINSELTLLSNVYFGRIMVIDDRFRIVRDTYELGTGRTNVSEQVIDCFRGEGGSTIYDRDNGYIEVAVPVDKPETEDIEGVILVSVSTNEIAQTVRVLERNSLLIIATISALVLVLGYLLSRYLIRPLHRVTNEIEAITDGFEAETISFDDYDAFIQMNGGNSLLDNVSDDYTDENGEPILIERIKKGSFDRYGKQLDLDLSAYRISLYWNDEEGIYLIPLQTPSDFLFANVFGKSLLYNTEAVYCADANLLGIADGEFTELGDSYYYSVPSGMLSEDLAWYSYCELCLALDNLYGLKESHDISSFDQVFRETGYAEDLMSTDPNIKDGALMDFINYYLDDMHSDFTFSSYLTDEAETIGGAGLASIRDSEVYQIYGQARENADHTIESYEEIGNTAYVTFDHFTMNEPAQTYYEGEVEVESDPASDSLETAALIIYANEQITREDSPIENVVIDLSLNGGGAVDAAALVAAWYLGEASMSLKSTMTGATSTSTYRADINLDREFDEKDTVQDKNLFCIISPYSFSCGNLVANLFKSSGRVALIGRESGGGSCAILPISTAYGSLFQISSPLMISYMKNGSYYDTDTGIEPECVIVRPENFYDREALTQYINQLY